MQEIPRTVESVGKDYIALLNRIGAHQNLSYMKDVEALCAPNVVKIVNGEVWFKNVADFLPQLIKTGKDIGFWNMEALDIIPGKDDRTVVLRFIVKTEKGGNWMTMVIIRCNGDLRITEIKEVFNTVKGSL